MRILAIAELYPWPAVDGYRQRLDHVLRGLTRAATVDVFTLVRPGHPEPEPPDIEGIDRVVTTRTGELRGSRQWMPEWTRGDLPRRLLSLDWTEARRELAAWGPSPDLIWYSHVHSWSPTHDLFPHVPAIVDFDNLENLAIRLRRRVPPRIDPGAGARERVLDGTRWLVSRAFDAVDEPRWDKVQRRCAAEVDRVVVCSPLDVERSGCDNAVVISNGADAPVDVRTDRRGLAGGHPTMLFVGALDYGPNTEAVEWFVREVLPLVRLRRPEAVVRIVGRGAERFGWMAGVAGVELVGEVPAIRAELDRADVSVVPIRVGAGTRLKVVEAMAHHIPLVTTSVGCEGIDLVDGTDALIADDPRRFADGCLRLLGDGELRQCLADGGARRFEASFLWDGIGEQVADLAREVVRA